MLVTCIRWQGMQKRKRILLTRGGFDDVPLYLAFTVENCDRFFVKLQLIFTINSIILTQYTLIMQ